MRTLLLTISIAIASVCYAQKDSVYVNVNASVLTYHLDKNCPKLREGKFEIFKVAKPKKNSSFCTACGKKKHKKNKKQETEIRILHIGEPIKAGESVIAD